MSRQLDIIIAEGGISGASDPFLSAYRKVTDARIQTTAALFLSHLNANIVILESRPCRMTSTEGGIVMLGPNGMHVLQGLELAEALHNRPNGVQVSSIDMYESSSGRLGTVPQGSAEHWLLGRIRVLEIRSIEPTVTDD